MDVEKKINIAYFNCTGAEPHVGGLAVANSHLSELCAKGYSVKNIYTPQDTSVFRRATRAATRALLLESKLIEELHETDAIVINGEDVHHRQIGGELLCIAEIAKEMNKPTFIVNAVIEEMNGWLDILSRVDGLTVHEVRSANYLAEHNIAHRMVLDSFLHADFTDTPRVDYSSKTVVTDWQKTRDNDVGEILIDYYQSDKESNIFLPFHDWSFIENQNWKRIVSDLSTSELIITGRHHGVCASILSGKPFVALPSNMHNAIGISERFDYQIPVCTTFSDLDNQIKKAKQNPNLFLELREAVQAFDSLSTFDELYQMLPSSTSCSAVEVEQTLIEISAKLYSKALKNHWHGEFNRQLVRIKNQNQISDLKALNELNKLNIAELKQNYTKKIDTLVEREQLNRAKTTELKDKLTHKIDALQAHNQLHKDKLQEVKVAMAAKLSMSQEKLQSNSEKYKEKLEQLKEQAQSYKSLLQTERLAKKNLKNIELSKFTYARKEYALSHNYALQGLKVDPINETLISILFRSESGLEATNQSFIKHGPSHLTILEQLPDCLEKYKALALGYGFGTNYQRAVECYQYLLDQTELTQSEMLSYCVSLFSLGRIDEAIQFAESLIESSSEDAPNLSISMAKHLAVMYNSVAKYDATIALSEQIDKKHGTGELRPVYVSKLCKGELPVAWQSYVSLEQREMFSKYFEHGFSAFQAVLCNDVENNDIVIYMAGGVGDEIRHSSLYNELVQLQGSKLNKVSIACDVRLQGILKRSYPSLNFVPCSRSYVKKAYDSKMMVPSEIQPYINDELYQLSQASAATVHCYSLMSSFRNSYKAFEDAHVVNWNVRGDLKSKWQKQLANINDKVKIGFNRGTHLSGSSREANIIELENWVGLFKACQHVEFINLSFNLSKQEIEEFKNRYGISNVSSIEDIDLRDDFENSAALLASLNLVITPPNMIVDFAGAVGVKTICLYTTAEYNWRFFNDTNQDVWHQSVTGMCSDKYGNKDGLMEKVEKYILENFT